MITKDPFAQALRQEKDKNAALRAVLTEFVNAASLSADTGGDRRNRDYRLSEALAAATPLLNEHADDSSTTATPEHLTSSHPDDICRNQHCQEAVKKNPATGRYFITMGHAGFNSPANNAQG